MPDRRFQPARYCSRLKRRVWRRIRRLLGDEVYAMNVGLERSRRIPWLENALMKWLEKYADFAYALLRIMAGLMFSFHGAQKIFGVLSEFRPPLGSLVWFAGIIELLGGLAVMLGLKARVAAFLCNGEMAVAYFLFHWKFQIGPKFFPTINQGELAVLYCFVFLYIACRGGVKWSLDKREE